MIKVNATKDFNKEKHNVMPMPLKSIEESIQNFYDENKDKAYMQFLQSNIYKALEPFVLKALEEEKYNGSPIYNGYIDKDTIGTIVDKVIYYAEQEIPDISDVVANIEATEYSKIMLLRAVIQSMVLNELFYEIRPNTNENINFESEKPNDLLENDEYTDLMLINISDIMPKPLKNA